MEGWKNAGLDRTVTLGRAVALLTAPPLSYQAIRELLIFELVLHLPEAIWIVIDLTFHELLPYLLLLWVTKKKLGISQLPDDLIAQCVQRNRAVMGWSSAQDCFFFSVLCNCFSCFLNCNDHLNFNSQPFLTWHTRILMYYLPKFVHRRNLEAGLSWRIIQLLKRCFFFKARGFPVFVLLKIIQISIRCGMFGLVFYPLKVYHSFEVSVIIIRSNIG